MSKEIEEMAKAICGLNTSDGCFCDGGYCNYNCLSYEKAENLYKQDYRKQEWISVEERLPEIDPCGKGRYGGQRSVRVLCVCKPKDGRTFVKEGYYEPCGDGSVYWRIPGSVNSVTHWMPLPAPPKMKGGA